MAQARNDVDSQHRAADPQDWVTIWQSEWAALAVDREVQEGLIAMTDAWNTALAARADGSPGFAGSDAAAGTTPTSDASGVGQPGATRP